MALIRPRSLIYPGSALPGFDPSHVALRGNACRISAAVVGGSFVNLLSGRAGALVAAPTFNTNATMGPVATFIKASSQKITLTQATTATGVTSATILCIANITSGGSGIGGNSNSSSLQVNNSNFLAYNNGSSSTLSGFALPSAPCFIAVSVNSSNLYAYAKNLTNGKVLSSSGTGANPGANADSANFAVAQESLLGHFGDGQIAAIAYLTGVTLGPAMLAALGADPWAFWYPNFGTLTPAFFSQPGSGGATTMAAAAGTFTLTGEAAIFEDFDPTTVAGAFVLTGEPATTLYALTAAQGSFAETGQGVTFLALTLMIAAQGTFTETGEPALFEQFLASAGGVYALTGFSALLGAPAAFLVAGGGTFILMGRPAIELLSSGWRTWYGPVTQWSSTTKPANNWTLEPPRVPWSQG